MGQLVEVFETKIGEVVARYSIKQIEAEVCDQHGRCRTVMRRYGVLTSITLPNGYRIRRDVDPEEVKRVATELGIPDETPLRTKTICGDSKACY